jgi:hypothetical protein
MSRVGSGDMLVVKPSNNVYTVLVILATLASVLAFVVVMMRHKDVFGQSLFS